VHPAPCKTKCILDGVEVLIVMTMKNTVFWVVMPCKSETASHFGGTYSLNFQGQRISHERYPEEEGGGKFSETYSYVQGSTEVPFPLFPLTLSPLIDNGHTLLDSFTILFRLELGYIRLNFSSIFPSDCRPLLLVSCIAYFYTLKMEIICSSEI
jgi:hypothetical protein